MGDSVVLVGGVGYVGYNLAIEHISKGDTVIVIARRASVEKRPGIATSLRRRGARLEVLGEPRELTRLLEGSGCPRRVYILVGRLRGPRQELYASNVMAVRNYAEATLTVCPDTLLVYTSALAVYGRAAYRRCGVPIPQVPSPCHCCGPRSPYGRSKLEAEQVLVNLAQKYGGRVLLARLGLFAGRRPYHREWRLLLAAASRGLAPASNVLLHISTAAGLRAAADMHRDMAGVAAAVNVVDATVTLRELAHGILAALSPPWRLTIPMPGRRTVKLLDSLPIPFGLLGDILWSLYAEVESATRGVASIDDIAASIVAEPPEP